jgi:hypothetical protein
LGRIAVAHGRLVASAARHSGQATSIPSNRHEAGVPVALSNVRWEEPERGSDCDNEHRGIGLLLHRLSRARCFLSEIGMFEPLRQICFAGRRL